MMKYFSNDTNIFILPKRDFMRLKENIYHLSHNLIHIFQNVYEVNKLTHFIITYILLYTADIKTINSLTSLTQFQFFPSPRHLQQIKNVNAFSYRNPKIVNIFLFLGANFYLTYIKLTYPCHNNNIFVNAYTFFKLYININSFLILSLNFITGGRLCEIFY